MKLESFIPAKALNRTRFQDGDIEYQIEGEELTTHFSGHYTQLEVEYKLRALKEANELWKKFRKFPFPQILDGRRVTTEVRCGILGQAIYRAIVWCKPDDIDGDTQSELIYTIYECEDLWQLREIVQYYEPKHNPKSLCY